MTGQEHDSSAQLRAALHEGQEAIRRVSQHVCLLERRLRGGGERNDLVVLVQDIKCAIADLQTLFQSAAHAASPAHRSHAHPAAPQAAHPPLSRQRVALGPLLTHCVAVARQRRGGTEAAVRFNLASDLPVVTAHEETIANLFSLLFEYAFTARGSEQRVVSVRWMHETVIVDIDHASRGLAPESYARLRQLVEQLDGTFRVSHELGRCLRVELTVPPPTESGSQTPHVVPLRRKEKTR